MLDFSLLIPYNRYISKNACEKLKRKKQKMVNLTKAPTVGSQFVTQKSGTTGIVQEVIQNKNGTFRVRLDVNGSDRWTTIK